MSCVVPLDRLELIGNGQVIEQIPLSDQVAAVSCGLYQGTGVLDLDYAEDSTAAVDMNLVATGSGRIVVLGSVSGTLYFGFALPLVLFVAILFLRRRGIEGKDSEYVRSLST